MMIMDENTDFFKSTTLQRDPKREEGGKALLYRSMPDNVEEMRELENHQFVIPNVITESARIRNAKPMG